MAEDISPKPVTWEQRALELEAELLALKYSIIQKKLKALRNGNVSGKILDCVNRARAELALLDTNERTLNISSQLTLIEELVSIGEETGELLFNSRNDKESSKDEKQL